MSDITLVNVGVPIVSMERRDVCVPMGVLSLAAYLEQCGHTPTVRDYQCCESEDLYQVSSFLGFVEGAADVIGISCMSKDLPFVVLACRQLKRARPEQTIVLGGPGPSGVAQKLLGRFPWIDFVVIGEGEKTLVELLENLGSQDGFEHVQGLAFRDSHSGEVIRTPSRERIIDLESLPLPAYHLVEKSRYTRVCLSGSRGCLHHCAFCDQPAFWRGRLTQRPIQSLIKELELLHELAVDWEVAFADNEFCADDERFERFYEAVKASGLRFDFSLDRRIDRTDEETLAKIREIGGVQVLYGIESGSDRVLERIRKNFTAGQARAGLVIASRHMPATIASFIFNFPYETLEDFLETLNLIYWLYSRKSEHPVFCQLHYLAPLPRTTIFRQYGKQLALRPVSNLMTSIKNGQDYSAYRSQATGNWIVLPRTLPRDRQASPLKDVVAQNPDIFPSFFTYCSPDLEAKERILWLLRGCAQNRLSNVAGVWGEHRFFIGRSKIHLFGTGPGRAVRVEVDPGRVDEFCPPDCQTLFLSFAPGNPRQGSAVLRLLDRLKQGGIDYRVVRPLADLLSGDRNEAQLKRYGIPADCSECLDRLCVREDDRVAFCHGGVGKRFDRYWKPDRLAEDFHKTCAGACPCRRSGT